MFVIPGGFVERSTMLDESDALKWRKKMPKGKPSKGTGKDKRLKRNRGKKKRK